jgi:hypothetical protein
LNLQTVKSLFNLFSGRSDSSSFQGIIELSVAETQKMLIDESYIDDARLNYLAAAIANFRFQQIDAARNKSESVYAGKLLTSKKDSGTLGYAEKLMNSYMILCRDIIKPQTFIFMSVGSKAEVSDNA